jgi:predicted DNA binding protein
MAQADMRVQLSDGGWKTDVSRSYGSVSVRLLSAVLDCGRASETVLLSGCDLTGCLSEIETHSGVDSLEVVDRDADCATVQLKTSEPAVLSAASRAGTPFVYPAVVDCGELIITVAGTHAGISALGDLLRADGLDFEVESVQSKHEVEQILTDRQEEVLLAALRRGYYKNPRECTLTEVAETLGIAKSTCSATLQRAEEAIVEQFCRRR